MDPFCGVSLYNPFKTYMEGLIPKYEPPGLKTFGSRAKAKFAYNLKFNWYTLKWAILDFGRLQNAHRSFFFVFAPPQGLVSLSYVAGGVWDSPPLVDL